MLTLNDSDRLHSCRRSFLYERRNDDEQKNNGLYAGCAGIVLWCSSRTGLAKRTERPLPMSPMRLQVES